MTQKLAFLCKQFIELLWGDVVAFQLCPCVGMGIVRVHPPNEVTGETVAGLITIEGLKRAGQNDSAKVPQNGSNGELGHLFEARRCG